MKRRPAAAVVVSVFDGSAGERPVFARRNRAASRRARSARENSARARAYAACAPPSAQVLRFAASHSAGRASRSRALPESPIAQVMPRSRTIREAATIRYSICGKAAARCRNRAICRRGTRNAERGTHTKRDARATRVATRAAEYMRASPKQAVATPCERRFALSERCVEDQWDRRPMPRCGGVSMGRNPAVRETTIGHRAKI